MNSVRSDRDVLDLAIKMGLVNGERADDLRKRLDGGGTMAENVLRDAGLSPEDRTHLSYVAERIHTVMERAPQGGRAEAGHPTAAAAPAPGATPLPRGDGRYRIDSMHAAGGMGRVWCAFDEILQRPVALKDIRPDVLRPEVTRRFLDEAKITARLEHPGIIPVYDMPAGDVDPCYVMRFVRGKTFAKALGEYHHKRRQFGPDSVEFFRLVQAFHSICQTVAYAHAQNVLHRDLKPANVLLGDFGEVLVLDWGLAKDDAPPLDSAPAADQPIDATQIGQIMGTPAYMSPEQSMGDSKLLTPRSDVWALGVILYELLAGEVPFQGDSTNATLRLVREQTPKPPRAVNSRAPRGLEGVCLKAMAKAPENRYGSAQELADDVSRWLADEPVRACPEPFWARLARWGRRHKALVAGLAALAISFAIALPLGTFYIERQRARADKALDFVESFFLQVSENRLLNEPGMQSLRAELLRSAVALSEKFAQEYEHDPTRKAEFARVKLILGRLLIDLNEPKQSLEALERSRELFRALAKANPRDAGPRRGEALATLSLGLLRTYQGDSKRAEEAFQDAIEQYKRIQSTDSALGEPREKLALAMSNLGVLKKSQGDLAGAATLYESAIPLMEELAKAAPDNIAYADNLAGIHGNLAEIWLAKKDLPKARTHLEVSGAIREELAKKGVKDLNIEDSLAASKNHLGNLALGEKRYVDAEANFRDALRLREALVRRNPDVSRLKMSLASAHYSVSRALARQNQLTKAIAEMDRCLDILEQMAAAAPKDVATQAELGKSYLFQAYYLYDARKLAPADQLLSKSIARFGGLGDDLPKAAALQLKDAYWTRAMVRRDQGRADAALADYDSALQRCSESERDALTKERAAAARKARPKGESN
jgi:tetratricopeptide (TPR) repeat protein